MDTQIEWEMSELGDQHAPTDSNPRTSGSSGVVVAAPLLGSVKEEGLTYERESKSCDIHNRLSQT